jgi:hypothetical protein
MRRRNSGALPVAAAALLLLAGFSGCSAAGYQRFKAHGAAAMTSGVGGAGAVAIGGPAGLAVFGAGVLLAVIVDQTLEPEPEEHTRTVTTVVQIPPPLPDGTPAKPVVQSFVNREAGPAPDNLKLPGVFNLPNPLTWGERLWLALCTVWWVIVGLFVIFYVLKHPKVRSAIWGSLCFAWDLLCHLIGGARDALRKPKG